MKSIKKNKQNPPKYKRLSQTKIFRKWVETKEKKRMANSNWKNVLNFKNQQSQQAEKEENYLNKPNRNVPNKTILEK